MGYAIIDKLNEQRGSIIGGNFAQEFRCSSEDVKPTDGVNKYDTLRELDTLDLYWFDGTQWNKCGTTLNAE